MNPVYITTCSKNKVGFGLAYENYSDDFNISDKLLYYRSLMYDLLRNNSPIKLRYAVKGPDFVSGSKLNGSYQPAIVRYARGQFVTSLENGLVNSDGTDDILKPWLKGNKVVFISGMYGLLEATEPIQNYDVELANLAIDHWIKYKQYLTEYLIGSIDVDSCVLDCCGDIRYSSLIDWDKIDDAGILVKHAIAVDNFSEGAQVRAEAGNLASIISEKNLKKYVNGGEVYPGVNANIKFVNNKEFKNSNSELSGNLPKIGVINTPLNEHSVILKEATRRKWNNHFDFIPIGTSVALAKALSNGIEQCICLIPPRPHSYLIDWCGGKKPEDAYKGKLLKVVRPTELSIKLIQKT